MRKEVVAEVLGSVRSANLPVKALALAGSLNAPPIMNLTYNEGGNTLIGQRGGQPYIIVGMDSYEISKKFMEKDLNRKMTEEEVKMAFAIDYGVFKENVYIVEQPGDFHLDMCMAIVGENTILINDSAAAQKMFGKSRISGLKELVRKILFSQNFILCKVRFG